MSPVIIIAILVVLVLVVGAIWLRRQPPRQSLEAALQERVARMKHMADTRKFRLPDDADLDPQVEYLNVVTDPDTERSDLTLFAVGGIIETRLGLAKDEVRQFVQAGGWMQTADRFQTVDGGLRQTSQFERRRA